MFYYFSFSVAANKDHSLKLSESAPAIIVTLYNGGMASISRTPTIISPGEQLQPLTAISPSFHHLDVGPLHKHAGA